MLGFEARIQLGLVADHPFAETRHRPGERHHRQAAHQVVEDVEVDHQFCLRQWQVIHQVCQRVNKRQDDQTAHQLKQQAAQRHAAGSGIGGAVVEHRQQAGAKVSANHQTERHRERDGAGGR